MVSQMHSKAAPTLEELEKYWPGVAPRQIRIGPAEWNVLELIAQGMPNKEIAAALFLSENTVRAHMRSMMGKLGMDNRVQLAVWYVKGLQASKDGDRR